jgi:hypothetical protein
MILPSETPWYVASARKLIAERGEEAARRVAQYQRRHAPQYADILEAELKQERAA